MMRSVIWILTMGLGLGAVAGRAAANASPIATSMGDLRWGMSERDVSSYAKREHGASIEKSLVNFEGKSSRWDSSAIAGEFNYDDDQAMMVAKGKDGSENYYFFRGGKLWKYVKVLDKKGDYKKFTQGVEGKFGKGRVKKGELTPGQNSQWLEYMDRNSRMRAADSNSKRGFALIYEEMATVRELASLRPQKPSRLGNLSDDDSAAPKSELKATSAPSDKGKGDEIAKASPKRSIFGKENTQESEAEYQTRKQKVAAEQRERAQRAHERKEDAKKGEVLKQLEGLNDSDPLGGL